MLGGLLNLIATGDTPSPPKAPLMNDLMEKGLEGVPRDLSPGAGSALDPYCSPLCRFWVGNMGFGWGVYHRSFDDSEIRPVSGPFWRWKTAARVCGDLRRVQADAWQIALLSSAEQPVEAASGMPQNLVSPKTGEGG